MLGGSRTSARLGLSFDRREAAARGPHREGGATEGTVLHELRGHLGAAGGHHAVSRARPRPGSRSGARSGVGNPRGLTNRGNMKRRAVNALLDLSAALLVVGMLWKASSLRSGFKAKSCAGVAMGTEESNKRARTRKHLTWGLWAQMLRCATTFGFTSRVPPSASPQDQALRPRRLLSGAAVVPRRTVPPGAFRCAVGRSRQPEGQIGSQPPPRIVPIHHRTPVTGMPPAASSSTGERDDGARLALLLR